MSETAPILSAYSVSKAFGQTVVLRDISLDLNPGEVFSIVGENGAGKSTLMKILAGIHLPSRGSVHMDGRKVRFRNPEQAQEAGVALIHQEPVSFQDLTVAQNIEIGTGALRPGQLRSPRQVTMRARQVLDRFSVSIDPNTPMSRLSIADQQLVEIVCSLARDARVIIMDEPTAPLTPSETERLFGFMRQLKDEGRAVVFISHRLNEIVEISDRVMVLRDGCHVATLRRDQVEGVDHLVRLMIGRNIAPHARRDASRETVALACRGLSRDGDYRDVSFQVHRGEILGFGGLVGAGRTAVAETLFGVIHSDSGHIELGGEPVRVASPRDAIRCGLAFVPEDRAKDGLFLSMSVAANITAANPSSFSRSAFLSTRRERETTVAAIRDHDIKTPSPEAAVSNLSGGNQQKAILARWLLNDPEVLILDEPTRGVDVGAKEEIYRKINALADAGRAVLLISSDMTELLALSDRIIVFCEGAVTAELTGETMTEDNVMRAAVAGAHEHLGRAAV